MENKIKEEVKRYINKCNQHLFVKNDLTFLKVIPVSTEKADYCFYITFNEKFLELDLINIDIELSIYGKNTKRVISDEIFDSGWYEIRTIKNFKLMREKMELVYDYIGNNFDGVNRIEIENQIKKILGDISVKK